MKIDSPHPQYSANVEKWTRCRDTYLGQDAMRAKGPLYLPKISPKQKPGDYAAYLGRAWFFEAVGRTVAGFVGAVCRKEHLVTLPGYLKHLLGNVTGDNVGISEFIKSVLAEVLLTARAGLWINIDDNGNTYLSLYTAENITNWDHDRVVVHHAVYEPDADGVQQPIEEYLDMHMADGACVVTTYRKLDDGPGRKAWKPVSEAYPTRHGRPLDRLPWVWVSSVGPANRIENPPLLGLVNVSVSHYKSSADLEHGRHYAGRPTLYITGMKKEEGKEFYVGGASVIMIENPDAKVAYAEFRGEGLGSLERALRTKEENMAILGAAVFGAQNRQIETAEAARIRAAGENSLLIGIVSAVEEALTSALRFCDWWTFTGEGKISVKLNRDLCDMPLDPQSLTGLVAALQHGGITAAQFQWALQKSELLPPGDATASVTVHTGSKDI